jgi:hypothetical protein
MIETPLMDLIYKRLNNSLESAYGRGFHHPVFRVYITHEQYSQIKQEALSCFPMSAITVDRDKKMIFGQQIIVIGDTPEIRLVGDDD